MTVQCYQQFRIISQPDPRDPTKTIQILEGGAHALFSGGVLLDVAVGIDAVTANTFRVQNKKTVPPPIRVKALLDSGCTVTSIDQELAKKLNLKTIGFNQVFTANGPVQSPLHVVSLAFPGVAPGPTLKGIDLLTVQTVNLAGQQFGVLIGRDIMSRWAIHYNGPAGFISIAD